METEEFLLHVQQLLFRSYRTYEEWKPLCFSRFCCVFLRSYRTYEEWKQAYDEIRTQLQTSSYRTYEEWKQ